MRIGRTLGWAGAMLAALAVVASGAEEWDTEEDDGGVFKFLQTVERQAKEYGLVAKERQAKRGLQTTNPTPVLDRTDCGFPMTIDVKAQVEYHLYVDGTEVGYNNGIQSRSFETRYASSGAVTIAVEAWRDIYQSNFETLGGIAINVTVCNMTVISDQDWVCTDTRPWSAKWPLTSYVPNSWGQPWLVREDQRLYDGSSNFYLWAKSCSGSSTPAETVWCRATFTPRCPTTSPSCYKAQAGSSLDTSCLSDCRTAVKNMDFCSAVGYQLSSSCGTCSGNYLKSYKTYCEEQGCSQTQCQGTATPAPVPDTSCLSACTAGMAPIRSECDKQSYMFQSGCSANCAPSALAYAREECLNKKSCKSSQCSVFNTTVIATNNTGPAKPAYTPPPTPDLSCFIRCLGGMNSYSSYCDKINYALYSGCHNCPQSIIDWAKSSCTSYVDEVTGQTCTQKQCYNTGR